MTGTPATTQTPQSTGPRRAGWVLSALIIVAAVANLPLAVANVALPSIGLHFNASQTQLNLVAVAYSLGLACSVLWLGAVGDRYGRKQLLLLGVLLSLPACLVMAWAPSVEVLIGGRFIGGVAAGMAYPTTLSLITALWSGPARTRSIALWSAIGGAIAALGPLLAGVFLSWWWWGSVFLLTVPLIVLALAMASRFVPSHVNEASDPVDNLGGALSAVLVGAVILGINFAVVPNSGALLVGLVVLAVASLLGFLVRERRAHNPLYDLRVAGRRVFWVAACAGIIVFGSLMGAMFIGQQFLQNVLGYSTIESGLAILPAPVLMVLTAPRSAKLIETRGARLTLLIGDGCILAGFLTMLLLWGEGSPYWQVGLGYALVGAGVGFAGTPASHSLTGSVPVVRVGMASGTADLQRDLGGALLQSIFGALLTAGYASAAAAAVAGAPSSADVTAAVQSELTKSFDGAEAIAAQYPQHSQQIVAGARAAFVQGQDWAYTAAIVAVLLGILLVLFFFPGFRREQQLLAEYRRIDEGATEPPTPGATSEAIPRPRPPGEARSPLPRGSDDAAG